MRVLCIRPLKVCDFELLTEAFLRVSPQVALHNLEIEKDVNEPRAIFLEISKCRRLYSEESVILRAKTILKRLAVPARLQISDDPALSLALTHLNHDFGEIHSFSKDQTLRALPLDLLIFFSDPFLLTQEAQRDVSKITTSLFRLGLAFVSDFLKIPISQIPSRFGSLGILLHHTLENGHHSPWPRVKLREEIIENEALGDGTLYSATTEIEPLLFLVKRILDKVFLRLHGRGLKLQSLSLSLELEKYQTTKETHRQMEIRFPLPQSSSLAVSKLIQDRIYFEFKKRPIATAVNEIKIKVLETAPGHLAQRDFFSQKEEQLERWSQLVTRLSHRLGSENVFVLKELDRYLPEQTQKRISAMSPEALDEGFLQSKPVPKRPTRLLLSPKKLILQSRKVDHRSNDHTSDGLRDYLVCPELGLQWQILITEGPERLFGEWWSLAFKRDYYRYTSTSGDQLWVFKDLFLEKELFLHGFFD